MDLKTDHSKSVEVDVKFNLERLIHEEDTDTDRKITVDDVRIQKEGFGDKRFVLIDMRGHCFEVVGTYYLSNLLQELKLAFDQGLEVATLKTERIFENPVHRIHRLINTLYWDGLTRRIDEEHIELVLKDEKIKQNKQKFIYVPHDDQMAFQYFSKISEERPELQLKVKKLPETITPAYVHSLEHHHGLLTLALSQDDQEKITGVPYIVPGGRFNEMYGWDSYFIILGLLASGRIDCAKGLIDHFVYQIRHYGKILNANRTYYLTRSQPPFLTSAILAVYQNLPKNKVTKEWLKNTIKSAIREYKDVWMNPDRLTVTGLSRYHGSGIGVPPEVERGHFDAILQPYADAMNLEVREFEYQYREGNIDVPELDLFFQHDRAVRESGHDTTYRWWVDGKDQCSHFVPVDLNALLYKIEIDIARTISEEFAGRLECDGHSENDTDWWKRAEKRKQLIRQYLWDEQDQIFYDYHFIDRERYRYLSATAFYPLWACHPNDPKTFLVTHEEVEKMLETVLPKLEMNGGIVASSQESRGRLSEMRPQRQWDYPYGWAPHQMLIWQGLQNYGYEKITQRLVYRWLYTIIRNAVDYNGTIPEKFDVVKRTHEVFVEYGNVGTKFSYMTKEGFGWMNSSYLVGLSVLSEELEEKLSRFIPPEWIF